MLAISHQFDNTTGANGISQQCVFTHKAPKVDTGMEEDTRLANKVCMLVGCQHVTAL